MEALRHHGARPTTCARRHSSAPSKAVELRVKLGRLNVVVGVSGSGKSTLVRQIHSCEGQGVITHGMSFLPDVVAPCPACEGARFESETLHVHYMGKSAGEILRLTASEAAELFVNHPKIASPLRTLTELGAGYVQLGQGSHTLSGDSSSAATPWSSSSVAHRSWQARTGSSNWGLVAEPRVGGLSLREHRGTSRRKRRQRVGC